MKLNNKILTLILCLFEIMSNLLISCVTIKNAISTSESLKDAELNTTLIINQATNQTTQTFKIYLTTKKP